jgi:hypothetical protein
LVGSRRLLGQGHAAEQGEGQQPEAPRGRVWMRRERLRGNECCKGSHLVQKGWRQTRLVP